MRAVICQALCDEGYTTADGDHYTALRALPAFCRPCLVLLDLHGPAATVREALEYRHGAGVPIVALSTRPQVLDGSDVGAVALLPEPFELEDLLAAVGRHCLARG